MTASLDQSGVHAPASTAAAQSAPLRLSLACPKCGVTGWVKWTSLARGIHCPKCGCEFLIGRTGQVHSYRDLPQTRFTCPRCGKSGSLPTQLAVRKAECGDCKLPLVAGPDQRLHGAKEAAELQRAAAKARSGKPTYAQWLAENLKRDDGGCSRPRIGLAAATVVCAIAATALFVRSWLDDSPQTLARRFTQACLAGDVRSARRYIADDDVQLAEFERFWIRHFASIENKHRPKGDRPSIAVDGQDQALPARTLRVTMTSDYLGERWLDQVWHEQDGRWWFDAHETLAAQDAVARQPPRQKGKPPAPSR